MLPSTITISSILGDAGSVAPFFGGLIALVLGLSFGIWAIGYLIRLAKSARR